MFLAVTLLTTIAADILCVPLGVEILTTARDGEWGFWQHRQLAQPGPFCPLVAAGHRSNANNSKLRATGPE